MKKLAKVITAILFEEAMAIAKRYRTGNPKNSAESTLFDVVDKARSDIFSVFNRIKERAFA